LLLHHYLILLKNKVDR